MLDDLAERCGEPSPLPSFKEVEQTWLDADELRALVVSHREQLDSEWNGLLGILARHGLIDPGMAEPRPAPVVIWIFDWSGKDKEPLPDVGQEERWIVCWR